MRLFAAVVVGVLLLLGAAPAAAATRDHAPDRVGVDVGETQVLRTWPAAPRVSLSDIGLVLMMVGVVAASAVVSRELLRQSGASGGEPGDLGHLVVAQLPAGRGNVRCHLLRLGGTGDHRGHLG